MELNNRTNFKVTEYKKKDGEAGFYIFVANEGYCFRNNAEWVKDEDGNESAFITTAFTLFAHEIDKLADYDCIKQEKDFIIH